MKRMRVSKPFPHPPDSYAYGIHALNELHRSVYQGSLELPMAPAEHGAGQAARSLLPLSFTSPVAAPSLGRNLLFLQTFDICSLALNSWCCTSPTRPEARYLVPT